jgi:hypothetical protein
MPKRIASRSALMLLFHSVFAGSGCESAGTDAEVRVVRATLPGGGIHLRYDGLPESASEPLAFDLRIGVVEGDAHEMFGDVRAIEADEGGTIYVLDHQASEVRASDAAGRYQRTLTRKGQGPGELTAANGMVLARDGTLWIQDHGQWRMVGVNLEGEEVGRHPMHVRSYGYVWNGALDDRGRFWKPTSHSDDPLVFPPEPGLIERRARSYMKWFDPATDVTDSVYLGESIQRMHVTRTAAGGWINRAIPFAPQRVELIDPAGGFWTTSGAEYRIARLGEEGDTLLLLEIDLAPDPVTREDRQRFIESMLENAPDQRRALEELVALSPDTKPVIEQLSLDDEGRLWVRRGASEDEDPRYDLFARDGRYLGSVTLAFRPALHVPPRIRSGRIYALVRDTLDVNMVVRAQLPRLRTRNVDP